MTDSFDLIEEMARKQAEISKEFEEFIQAGEGNLPALEYFQARHNELGKYIEEMRQKHEELQPLVEEVLCGKKTEGEEK